MFVELAAATQEPYRKRHTNMLLISISTSTRSGHLHDVVMKIARSRQQGVAYLIRVRDSDMLIVHGHRKISSDKGVCDVPL